MKRATGLVNGMPQLGNFVAADSSDVEIQAAVMSRQMDASFSAEGVQR